MKNYKEQTSCHNCKHCFVMEEYDSYCTHGAPPIPRCGSVFMKEDFSSTEGPYNDKLWEENFEKWEAWEKSKSVKCYGMCTKKKIIDN